VSRARSAALVGAVIALGAASRVWPIGRSLWDKSAGDAAYAMMLAFALSFVWPRMRSLALGITAFALSLAIELFQLTGLPARAPRLIQIALGTTFAWHDVACYAVGGAAAALVHRFLSQRHLARVA
jgi:hypothetical protein